MPYKKGKYSSKKSKPTKKKSRIKKGIKNKK